jgi:hypothetical protein
MESGRGNKGARVTRGSRNPKHGNLPHPFEDCNLKSEMIYNNNELTVAVFSRPY